MPLESYSNPYNYYTGNDQLQPEISYSYEINYNKTWDQNSFTTEIFLRDAHDLIQRVQHPLNERSLLATMENVGRSIEYGTEVMANVRPWTWWHINASLSLSGYNLFIQYQDQESFENNFNYGGRLQNTFELPRKFSLNLNGRYVSPQQMAQGVRDGYFTSDLSIKKRLGKSDRWSATLIANNILNTFRYEINYAEDDFSYYFKYANSPYLSLNINFSLENKE